MTIFAPSDTAFDSLTEEEKKSLIDNKQTFNGKYIFIFFENLVFNTFQLNEKAFFSYQ